jgi:tetratricopeptide (TPR) repeat protein
VDVGFRLYAARRYAEAIAPIQKVLEFNPDFIYAHRYLGQVYEANRMYQEALAELRRTVELSGAPIDVAALGHAYAVSGSERRRVRRSRSLSNSPGSVTYQIMIGLWSGPASGKTIGRWDGWNALFKSVPRGWRSSGSIPGSIRCALIRASAICRDACGSRLNASAIQNIIHRLCFGSGVGSIHLGTPIS